MQIIRAVDSTDWDGRRGCPVGVYPQYPSLLFGYAFRPPWAVAGVDYGVGPAYSTVFKNPLIDALPVGATKDTTNKFIRCNSINNLTFDGWDFSLNNGYRLYINGTSDNTTVTNCNFAPGSNNALPIVRDATAGALTVRFSKFDGQQTVTASPLISGNTAADLTVEYCWFKDIPSDGIGGGSPTNPGPNWTIRFNLFDSSLWSDGPHGDFVQSLRSINSYRAQFNTFYQPAANGSGLPGGMDSFLRAGDLQAGDAVTKLDWGYNTAIGIGSTGHLFGGAANSPAVSYAFLYGATSPNGTIINPYVHDNYVDVSGMLGFQYPSQGSGTLGAVFARNIKMTDGSLLTPPF